MQFASTKTKLEQKLARARKNARPQILNELASLHASQPFEASREMEIEYLVESIQEGEFVMLRLVWCGGGELIVGFQLGRRRFTAPRLVKAWGLSAGAKGLCSWRYQLVRLLPFFLCSSSVHLLILIFPQRPCPCDPPDVPLLTFLHRLRLLPHDTPKHHLLRRLSPLHLLPLASRE